jgi:integrase
MRLLTLEEAAAILHETIAVSTLRAMVHDGSPAKAENRPPLLSDVRRSRGIPTMPRPRKPARLYFRADERQWVVRDGARQIRTGYSVGQRGEAETALAQYLNAREPPSRRGPAYAHEVTVGEALAKYVDFKTDLKSPGTLITSVAALSLFWGDLTCDAVKGSTCRAYTAQRAIPREVTTTTRRGNTYTRMLSAGPATARRDLGVLQAALNHAHAEGLLIHPIKVTLSESGQPKDRWLTRSEAAALLRAAAPHVRRFILVSLYSGRRMSAVLELTWIQIDLAWSTIRFRADGEGETNKRRGRVRIPRQLAAHLRRWHVHARTETHVVSWRGKTIDSIKKGFQRAAERAGLDDITPHVLKHTAITWAVMAGLGLEDAAEYFNTSPATLRKHYWHHSPHHQERALEVIERRRE